jgi:hypothetical protein
LTLTGGADKTKILFSANYVDEQGMKLNSFLKRANAAFKLTQKVYDNLTFYLDTRYTSTQNLGMKGQQAVAGLCSLILIVFVLLQLLTF